jgi:hypothetical protein
MFIRRAHDNRTSKTWKGMEVERRGGSVSGGVEAGGLEDFSRAVESAARRICEWRCRGWRVGGLQSHSGVHGLEDDAGDV